MIISNRIYFDYFKGNRSFCYRRGHCISTWGHDFRPDYKLLTKRTISSLNKDAAVLFCTATADQKVIEDISSKNELSKIITGDLYRRSLSIYSLGEQTFKFSVAWFKTETYFKDQELFMS